MSISSGSFEADYILTKEPFGLIPFNTCQFKIPTRGYGSPPIVIIAICSLRYSCRLVKLTHRFRYPSVFNF